MQRVSLSALVIAALVAFAGCNAFGGGQTTPTLTPVDVPTDEPTPTVAPRDTPQLPGRCTPGLTRIGFANGTALAAAHNATLRNTSFSVRDSSTRIYRNGSIAAHGASTLRVAENYSRIHYIDQWIESSRSPTPPQRFELWTNGTRVVTRRSSGPTARYEARPLPPAERGHFRSLAQHYASIPENVLGNATVCVTDRFSHNGTTLFVVAFTRPEPPYRLPPNATFLRNVAGRALVDSSGIVHELRWNYTVRTGDGAIINATTSTFFADIGSTTVERPLWYGRAINETNARNETSTGS